MRNKTKPKEQPECKESLLSTQQEDSIRFDFTRMIEDEHERYIFEDDAKKHQFISKLKNRLDFDAYLWDQITQSIMIAAGDVANEMNIQEQE